MKRWWIFQLSNGEQVRIELMDEQVEMICGAAEVGARWIRLECGELLINAEHLVRFYADPGAAF